MKNNDGKTIAAISTAYGEGGIGIVRMSGEESLPILKKIFSKPGKKIDENNKFIIRHLHYGNIINPRSGKIIDEVLVSYMKNPNTYTKEDICEIYCHGSIVSLRKILEVILELGAEPANPGEFTKRAFLNGRMDLTQAEAVIDVIKAKSDVGFELAVDQMEGSISKKINELSEKLLAIIASIVVDIDYPDEDAVDVITEELKTQITDVNNELIELIDTANAGKMIKEGINAVIAGKPNVGKSSLMNELLKESRAIVTEIPGTTRDTIEEIISINGIPIKLTDTAGIRDTTDEIEKIGIEKTKKAFNNADLIIFMLDGDTGLDDLDDDIAQKIGEKNCFVVINKIDLNNNIDINQIRDLIPQSKIINMSIKEETGLDELEKEITEMVYSGKLKQENSLVITNLRHKNLLKNASLELTQAINMLESGEALDFVHVNINQALEYIGEITGQSVSEDIIDKVFSEFCVGK